MIPISDRLYASFIGPNWHSHYRNAFARLEEGGGHGLSGSWNSAAALVPYWFFYRRLTVWAFIFFLGSLLLYAVLSSVFALFSWMRFELFLLPFLPAYLTTCLVQGAVADRLLRQKAVREINRVRRTAPDETSAMRTLAQGAPRGRDGGYVPHALLMLVGMPAWALAVLGGTRILSPQYGESQSVYIALMRTALRDVSVVQENFFSARMRYSQDIRELGYQSPADVTIHLTAASDSGWSAIAQHVMVSHPCRVFVGRVAGEDQRGEEGVPFCPNPAEQ